MTLVSSADTRLPVTVAGRSLPAFGSTLSFWVTDATQLERVDWVVRAWIDAVDRAGSRFRDDSDLSRLNRAGGAAVEVAPILIDAVEASLAMARLTNGLYDPSVGRALVAAGYDQPFDTMPRVRSDGARRPAPAGRWPEVRIDREAGTIRLPRGVSLDLGGSAKGWSVDAALDLCWVELGAAAPSVGICISAGGDMAVAGPPPEGGWPVRLAETLDARPMPEDSWMTLRSGAVATSGALRRRWTMGDREAHHIIDPRTGEPGHSCWRLVTVMASQCLVADTAATAAWLLGAEAPGWLRSIGAEARLVAEDGSVTTVGRPAMAPVLQPAQANPERA
ncbi:MAG TPA: FAD:protein FMN transferase [Candidatus Solibacter sp.]|nr:FAD:protein FMN transferase [Candidatus Solibacter sp.]